MSHIDTLKTYEDLVASGIPDAQARAQVDVIDRSLKYFFKELKSEFVTNKIVSIIGGLILIVTTTIGGELWYLSKEFSSMNIRIGYLEQKIK